VIFFWCVDEEKMMKYENHAIIAICNDVYTIQRQVVGCENKMEACGTDKLSRDEAIRFIKFYLDLGKECIFVE